MMHRINFKKIFLTNLLFTFITGVTVAQISTKSVVSDSLSLDPKVRIGKLANGFTYYIQHSDNPKNKVELHLIIKAGMYWQDDDQDGLAHILEHMAFNGLVHFPEPNSLKDFFDRAGLKPGGDWNASPGYHTKYYLVMPVDKPKLVDSGFMVLRDWAKGMLLKPEEVDNERGVVIGENRRGMNYSVRMNSELEGKITNHPKWIGASEREMNNILNFKYNTLLRFYNDWYRPDLQAAIIVGDVDIDEMEKKIKSVFSDLKMPDKPRSVKDYTKEWGINLSGKNRMFVITDPEMPNIIIQINMKHKRGFGTFSGNLATKQDYRQSIYIDLYNEMVKTHFEGITAHYNVPIAAVYHKMVAEMMQANTQLSNLRTDLVIKRLEQIKPAFKIVMTEIERIKRYGFTNAELLEAKAVILKNWRKEKAPNSHSLADIYAYHFSEGVMAAEFCLIMQLKKQLLDEISINEINEKVRIWISDTNRDIAIKAPSNIKAKLPGATEINSWLAIIKAAPISQNKLPLNNVIDSISLIRVNVTSAATIISTQQNNKIGTTNLKLSNGVELILKPLQDQGGNRKSKIISLYGYSSGGTSLYAGGDYLSAKYATSIVQHAGVGDFNKFQLDKFLARKMPINVYCNLSDDLNEIYGTSTRENIETTLQLIYLHLTSPRKDKKSFEDWKGMILESTMKKKGLDESFKDTIASLKSNKSKLITTITKAELDKIRLDKVYQIYNDCYSDPSRLTFIISGDFDVESITSFLVKYLGSIPKVKKVNKTVYTGNNEKAEVELHLTGKYNFNDKNNILMDLLGQALHLKIHDRIREKEGASYAPTVRVYYLREPENNYDFQINFDCSVDKVEYLIAATLEELDELRNKGLDQKIFEKVLAFKNTELEENRNSAHYWQKYLKDKLNHNEEPVSLDDLENILKSITIDELKVAADKYFSLNNLQQFVWMPEKYKPTKVNSKKNAH